jgi:hypothetical protein
MNKNLERKTKQSFFNVPTSTTASSKERSREVEGAKKK